MDGFVEQLEVVSLGAGVFQKIGCARLSGKEEYAGLRTDFRDNKHGIDAVQLGHNDI